MSHIVTWFWCQSWIKREVSCSHTIPLPAWHLRLSAWSLSLTCWLRQTASADWLLSVEPPDPWPMTQQSSASVAAQQTLTGKNQKPDRLFKMGSFVTNWLEKLFYRGQLDVHAVFFLLLLSLFSHIYQQTNRSVTVGTEQCSLAHDGLKREAKKTRSWTTSSQGASFATHKIPLPVQDHNSCLPPFWRVFTHLSFFISLHVWTIPLSLILIFKQTKTAQNSKCNLKFETWLMSASPRNVPTLSQFKSHLKAFLCAQAFQQNPSTLSDNS